MIGALCASGFLFAFQASTAPGPETFDFTLVIAQAPHHADHEKAAAGRFAFANAPPDGGRIILLPAGGVASTLTPEFVSAADPSLSFDGKKVIFAGKRTARESWNIWEMDLEGKNKRQITRELGNCREPRYLATSSITPPEFDDKVRWITFTSDAAATLDEYSMSLATALYAQNVEPIAGRGTVTRRSTFNLSSDFSPTVLGDGRIVFTSHQPGEANRGGRGRYPLLVTNWDGTGLNIFTGAEEGPLLRTMACEASDRTLIFVESEGETADGSGQLARISLKRPLRSREVLTRGEGLYRSPHPLPDGRVLVSFGQGKESRGIYLFNFAAGAAGRKIHGDPKWDDEDVVAVALRPEPQGLISAVIEAETTADLHCIDVYESDLPEAKEIKKGDVKSARFVEGVPIPSTDANHEAAGQPGTPENVRIRILGEAPVEADGSFFVRVPADTPFYIQTLDGAGMALQTLRSWIWVRRGTSRGCIGCHEDKELAPENRATQALIKIQPHSLIEPPGQRRRGADFHITLQPIIQRQCASCHGGSHAAGGLNLNAATAQQSVKTYESLLALRSRGSGEDTRYIMPGSARNSMLVRILSGGGAGTNGSHPAVKLNEEERRILIEWIDLGARWEN